MERELLPQAKMRTGEKIIVACSMVTAALAILSLTKPPAEGETREEGKMGKRQLTRLMAKRNPLAEALAEAEIVAARAWRAWGRQVVPYALSVKPGDVVRCAVTWRNNTAAPLSRHIISLYGVVEEGEFYVYTFTYEGVEYFVASYAMASGIAAGAQVVTNVDWRAMFSGYTFDAMVFTGVVTNPAEVTVLILAGVVVGISSNMRFTYDDSRLCEDAVSVVVPAETIGVTFTVPPVA